MLGMKIAICVILTPRQPMRGFMRPGDQTEACLPGMEFFSHSIGLSPSFSAPRTDWSDQAETRRDKITDNLQLLCGNENLVTVISITITIITITQVSHAWENNSGVMRSQDIRNFLCVSNLFVHCSFARASAGLRVALSWERGWLTLNGRKNENFAFTLTRDKLRSQPF